jgi:acylphosphatase
VNAAPVAWRWVVSGRVQGVGFRWFVLRRAQELDLVGWVSNLPDGRVEVAAQGTRTAIEALEAAITRGPRIARVDHVEKHEIPHEMADYKSFHVR